MLVLLLGSNIGNFDAPAALDFLRRIRLALEPGDLLLLGADLVKPEPELRLAYDDPLGVTAAFNKNLLVRINRELGGNFDLAAFDHLAAWNAAEQRIEMHLVSRVAQTVTITAAGVSVTFAPGERIWTESSYKYDARSDRDAWAPIPASPCAVSGSKRTRASRCRCSRRCEIAEGTETAEGSSSTRLSARSNGETEYCFVLIQRYLRCSVPPLLRVTDPPNELRCLCPLRYLPPAKARRPAGRYPTREHQARARRHGGSMGEARAE